MADRLTRITTGTGDDGTTGLGDGGRIEKDAARVEAVNPHTRTYLNRLSDLLFILARVGLRAEGRDEVLWDPAAADGD